MKELIREQLNQINRLEDKVLLKDILNGVFLSLYEENTAMYGELEKRVFEELEYQQGNYSIKTNIIKKEDYDPTHHMFSPILMEDVDTMQYDLAEIQQNLAQDQPYFVLKAFVKCDYLLFCKMLKEKKTLKGDVVTDRKSYTAYFQIEQDKAYMDKVKKLYQLFILNGVAWNTVNIPYVSRMVRVFLNGTEEKIGDREGIKEVSVDFGEYSNYIYYNMVPIWNVKQETLTGVGFATPCIDHVNFEHSVTIKNYGENNGYLIEDTGEKIKYVRHNIGNVSITAEVPEGKFWSVFVAVQGELKKIDHFTYPFMSNEKKVGFTERLQANCGKTVKTKAELMRFIESFSVQGYLEFHSLEITDRDEQAIPETYSMDCFIEDEIRDKDYGKKLILYFIGKDKGFFAIRDLMSFVVSEVQILYSEYRCEGRLL